MAQKEYFFAKIGFDSVAGIFRSALPEGAGEVATGKRQLWLPVDSTCTSGISRGAAVHSQNIFSVQRCLLEFGPGGYQPHAYFRPHAYWLLVPGGTHPTHVYPTHDSYFKTNSEKSEFLKI